MKIYYQTNTHDCGIAVTQSLIFYFHKKEISREELYEQSNIKEHGLSIIDLENLNKKYGIILESYSINFQEFKNYKTKDYFILIINKDESNHYVIAKKNKKYVKLYDPENGKTKINYEDLEKIFINVLITVKKENNSIKITKKEYEKYKPDIQKVIHLFLINVGVFITTIISTLLIRYNFSNIYSNQSWPNIIKTSLMLIFLYVIINFGEYLEGYLTSLHKKQYSKKLTSNLIKSLNLKKNSYFQKLGNNQFLLLKDHIDNIATFQSEYINKRLISVIILSCLGLVLLCFNVLFTFLISISFASQYFFWKLSKKIYNDYFPKIANKQNDGKKFLYLLNNFIKNECNTKKLENLSKLYKNNYEEEINNIHSLTKKKFFYSKMNDFINNLIYVSIFIISSYLIFIKKSQLNHMIVIGFLYSHINKSINSLIGYYGFKVQYDYSKEIYSQLLNVDLIENQKIEFGEKNFLSPPKYIEIKNLIYGVPEKIIFKNLSLKIYPDTFIYGPSGIGKSVLYKLICAKINPPNESIFFEEKSTPNLDQISFKNLIIYQINDSYLDNLENIKWDKLLFSNLKASILNICTSMNINISSEINYENLSSGQKQFMNILNLLQYKNKVILLDEIASHINLKNKIEIFKNIIPWISKENFLICSEHCEELKQYFSNNINLLDVIKKNENFHVNS